MLFLFWLAPKKQKALSNCVLEHKMKTSFLNDFAERSDEGLICFAD